MPKQVKLNDIFEGRWSFNARSSRPGGVYVITHVPSGRFYVGSTIDFFKRQIQHAYKLRSGQHVNPGLQECYCEDPHFRFTFHLVGIEGVDSDIKENAQKLEQEYLDRFQGDPLLLNVSNSSTASRQGVPLSEEARAKISSKMKGRMPDCSARKRRPVSIDGIVYESARDAGRIIGMLRQYVEHRLKSRLHPDWFYLDRENAIAEGIG